jgi:hypothetical protein
MSPMFVKENNTAVVADVLKELFIISISPFELVAVEAAKLLVAAPERVHPLIKDLVNGSTKKLVVILCKVTFVAAELEIVQSIISIPAVDAELDRILTAVAAV